MATSISRAQAEALAQGFLDDIGSENDLNPTETYTTLIQLAGELIANAQENLVAVDRVESGALSESLKILNPEVVGDKIEIFIQALNYYKFIDKGVRGLKGGNGTYQFRTEKVSRKMMIAIRKWLIREGIKARTTKKYRSISRREAKRKTITETSNNVAYAIGRSIKRGGLKKTNFFTKAVDTTENKMKDLAIPYKIDIINSLPTQLDGNRNQ